MKNAVETFDTITFIGGGNMAASLIGGLIKDGHPEEKLRVGDPNRECPAAKLIPLQCYSPDNFVAMEGADVVVLAVKPQILPEAAKSIANVLPDSPPLIISIAAGISIANLVHWLGADRQLPIVRVMPNTPALIGCGASALFAGQYANNERHHRSAEKILRAVGLILWLEDETLMNAVTALSGCGPAYFFYLMEVLEKSAIKLGLPQESARLLTLQTAFGAAKMALESQDDAATLRACVTSKGGVTEQVIKVLQAGGLQALFDEALQAGQQHALELGK